MQVMLKCINRTLPLVEHNQSLWGQQDDLAGGGEDMEIGDTNEAQSVSDML